MDGRNYKFCLLFPFLETKGHRKNKYECSSPKCKRFAMEKLKFVPKLEISNQLLLFLPAALPRGLRMIGVVVLLVVVVVLVLFKTIFEKPLNVVRS